MLIIFDLDDTLIDTTGSVTPFKMRECLKSLVNRGLELDDFQLAYQKLMHINESEPSSKEALQKFLAHFGLELDSEIQAIMKNSLPQDFSIPTTPHAKEVLELFAKKHTLTLVTGGYPPFQLEKLEKAGIDRSFFSKIAIPEDSIKKPLYEGLIKEFSIHPQEVLVCGDRIAMDLAPAHQLGCKTVHMRWGRGKVLKGESWITYTISALSELKRIVTI